MTDPIEQRTSAAEVVRRLLEAPLEPVGRFADASNATLLVRLADVDLPSIEQLAGELGRPVEIADLDPRHLAVYKPQRGEAPLWDFPPGTLHRREVAAYEIACALGWDLVPITVLRDEGPAGPGSVQRFVQHDPELHYFRLLEDGDAEVVAALRRMVVFDLVIDNADRKGGHVLLEGVVDEAEPVTDEAQGEGERGREGAAALSGRIQVVDHGVSLNVETKLRTVAWEFAAEPPPAGTAEALQALASALEGRLGDRLEELLDPAEVAVLRDRVAVLHDLELLPEPWGPRAYPWPPL